MTETRVTDPKTGGQKGDKPEHMGDLDPEALLVLATVAGIGASKYSPHNYLRGYAWSLSFNAMMRHAFAFWAGENLDPETGQPHAAHAAWHGLALTSFLVRSIGTDDRPPRKPRDTPKVYAEQAYADPSPQSLAVKPRLPRTVEQIRIRAVAPDGEVTWSPWYNRIAPDGKDLYSRDPAYHFEFSSLRLYDGDRRRLPNPDSDADMVAREQL